MKIRLDFVTNSSSSSFILATKNIKLLPDFLKNCNYIYLNKDDNLATSFINLLSKLNNDYSSNEDFLRYKEWLKLLNLDNEDIYLNLMKAFFSNFLFYYDISILDKIKSYTDYYLIYYSSNLWNIPEKFVSYVNGKELILIDERTL